MIDQNTDADNLRMFGDSLRRALSAYPDALHLQRADAITPETVAASMALSVEQGCLAVYASEAAGGLGLGAQGARVIAREFGRSLLPGPMMAATVIAPKLARMEAAFGLLHERAQSGEALISVGAPVLAGDAYVVDHVLGATDALTFDRTDGGGVRVCWRATRGARARKPFDPTCPVGILGKSGVVHADVTLDVQSAESLLGPANIWIAAELVGAAQRAGELTIAYAGERTQFDRPIGTNQAIKHRVVDDYVLRENAEALVAAAAIAWDKRGDDRVLLAHVARAAASEAAISSTAHCIQVHGGLGFSWEHPAHLYYKRVRRLVSLLGSLEESIDFIGSRICTP